MGSCYRQAALIAEVRLLRRQRVMVARWNQNLPRPKSLSAPPSLSLVFSLSCKTIELDL